MPFILMVLISNVLIIQTQTKSVKKYILTEQLQDEKNNKFT